MGDPGEEELDGAVKGMVGRVEIAESERRSEGSVPELGGSGTIARPRSDIEVRLGMECIARCCAQVASNLGFADRVHCDVDAEIDTAIDLLTFFGPTREHFKTLYFQWELINLSRALLYASIPALIVAGAMVTFVGAESFSGTFLTIPVVTWVVSAAYTVTLVPFLLFTSYILRIAPVAKRTLAIGPLILRESQR